MHDVEEEFIQSLREGYLRKPPAQYPYQESWQARWHLEEYRGCSPSQCQTFWWEPETEHICIPIVRVDGEETTSYMTRHWDPDTRGWLVRPFETPRAEHCFRCPEYQGDQLVLVEGIFDVLTPCLERVAVACLGTAISKDIQEWLWMNPPKKAVIWMDPDDAGGSGAVKAKKIVESICPTEIVAAGTPEPGDLSPREAREVLSALSIHL